MNDARQQLCAAYGAVVVRAGPELRRICRAQAVCKLRSSPLQDALDLLRSGGLGGHTLAETLVILVLQLGPYKVQQGEGLKVHLRSE